jgi:adenine-specific DNA-methyltransferase
MQHLLDELTTLLQQEATFVAIDGKLLKNTIVEAALQLNPTLLKLLLSQPSIKKHFFQHVDEVVIFDKIKFQQFINNKAFLPDSYTAFKNKIGLTDASNYISINKEVILTWPYKDNVLEGGQTKDDSKRNEVFWHEILAADTIDRLLHPKAFTGFKKFDSNGTHMPETITNKDNFIVRGNNLIALHSLKPVYSNRIKLIYIDPPYNTGSDSFLYNDSFNHSTWLTFMKNRLEVAWQLLASDGCIFIQVDDTEFAYLKVLCDELFGRANFRENIILKSSTESGVNAINVKRGERLFKVKENILFYAKSASFRFKPFYTKAAFNTNYKYELVKTKTGYIIEDIAKKITTEKLKGRQKKSLTEGELYEIEQAIINYTLDYPSHIFSLEKNIKKAGEKFKAFAEKNKPKGIVEEFINIANQTVLIYDGGVLVPLQERIVTENGKNYFGVLASDLWVDIGTTASTEGGITFSNGKKPEKLLKRIIEMATNEGDIVLDYHLGSGTTAAVAHKLNRRYIGIEQMDYGDNDSIVRLNNVIYGDTTGISKSINWKGGGSFVYCELHRCNDQWVEAGLAATNSKETEALSKQIANSKFINFTVDKAAFLTHKKTFTQLTIDEQKKLLLNLLDLNYLYLPYTEIEDVDFKISTEEIALNKQFYTLKIS